MCHALVQTPIGIFTPSEARQKLAEAGLAITSETYRRLQVEIEVYRPHPTDSRYVEVERRKTPNEVWEELKALLPHYIPEWEGRFDYIDPCRDSDFDSDAPFPEYCWISCYVVTGGSEGHYLHVDLIRPGGRRSMMILGKTFLGPQPAWEVAIAIATILYA